MTLWCRLFHARHWRIIVGQYLDGTEAAILHCTRCDQHVEVNGPTRREYPTRRAASLVIEQEGTITIRADGAVHVSDFKIEGSLADLMALVRERLELAMSRWRVVRYTTPPRNPVPPPVPPPRKRHAD